MLSPRAYVHQAELRLHSGVDERAPGGAVTTAMCGHWEHEGACRWPHNSEIDAASDPAAFRTVFIASAAEEQMLRDRIDSALSADGRWSVVSCGPRALADSERPLAHRLAATKVGEDS